MKNYVSLWCTALLLLCIRLSVLGAEKEFAKNADKSTFISEALFVENKGQWPQEVFFMHRQNGLNAWITRSGVVYDFYKTIDTPNQFEKMGFPTDKAKQLPGRVEGHIVNVRHTGALASVSPIPGERAAGVHNYFTCNDPSKWVTEVPLSKEVRVANIYSGIDQRWYFDAGKLRYDYECKAGADPKQIKLQIVGAEHVFIKNGNLVFKTRFGDVQQADLKVYQPIGNTKKPIAAKWKRYGTDFGFELDSYDKSKPLVIDPVVWSTSMGPYAIKNKHMSSLMVSEVLFDANENPIVCGSTSSSNFPTTPGAYNQVFSDPISGGQFSGDLFVTKLNSNGNSLIFSTFIGGSELDAFEDAEIDIAGNIYVTGWTYSNNYPTINALKSNRQQNEGLLTKLNANGTALLFSTYIGGGVDDFCYGITLDPQFNILLMGFTNSNDYPTTSGAFKPTRNPLSSNYFISKITNNGAELLTSTFFNGEGNYNLSFYTLKTDEGGNVYLAGSGSLSSEGVSSLPTSPGALQHTPVGLHDGYVVKLNPTLSTLLLGTFIGGNTEDDIMDMALDGQENIYISGYTNSNNFSTTVGSYQTLNRGGTDGFISKLDKTGTFLHFSTLIAGTQSDIIGKIHVESDGAVTYSGFSSSPDYPTTSNADFPQGMGTSGGIIGRLSANGSTLLYSSFNTMASSFGLKKLTYPNTYITWGRPSSHTVISVGAYNSDVTVESSLILQKITLPNNTSSFLGAYFPISGPVGTIITLLSDQHFGSNAVVTVGNTPALVISNTENRIQALVMPGSNSGSVQVVSANGAATSNIPFNVVTTLPPIEADANIWGTNTTGKIPSPTTSGFAQFGKAVAISADGTTMVAGAPGDDPFFIGAAGSVFVFKKYPFTGNNWDQQGPKLRGSNAIGNAAQGTSVALSADGNLLAIGGPTDAGSLGAVWIFVQDLSSGQWLEEAKITPNDGQQSQFGQSISLSADGKTLAVGGPADNNNIGAFWIFTRSGNTWTQQGFKRTPIAGVQGAPSFGKSISLSGDGNRLFVGGPLNNNGRGAVWGYKREGNAWLNLFVNEGFQAEEEFSNYGSTVSTSLDGKAYIVGAPWDGSCFIYNADNEGNFSQTQRIKIIEPQGGSIGNAIALTGDGTVAMLGMEANNNNLGMVKVLRRINGVWMVQSQSIIPGGAVGASRFGASLAISPSGKNAVVGGTGDAGFIGATWLYRLAPQSQPTITSFAPTTASIGSIITINGTNLFDLSSVSIGGVQAVVLSSNGTQIKAMVMAGATSGSVSVVTVGGTADAAGFTITPLVLPAAQQGNVLSAVGGNANEQQGSIVALSADGNTMVVGTMFGDRVIIYQRIGSIWVEQSVLTQSISGYGKSLALSDDGNTLMVGSNGNSAEGVVYIYAKVGNNWVQQGTPIEPVPLLDGKVISSIALSANGEVAVFGTSLYSISESRGRVYVYRKQGSNWIASQVIGTNEPEGQFGRTVKLSADGSMLAIGAPFENNIVGAVYLFRFNGAQFVPFGQKLLPSGTGGFYFGQNMALSKDGSLLVVTFSLQANIYERAETGYQLNSTLEVGGTNSAIDRGVAITSDNNHILISGLRVLNNLLYSNVKYIHKLSNAWQNGAWINSPIGAASVADFFGYSLAFSANGSTLAAGATGILSNTGGGYIFTAGPTISDFTPKSAATGQQVSIHGLNLSPTLSAVFGGTSAVSFLGAPNILPSATVTATVGSGSSGAVTITTPLGVATLDGFSYISNAPVITSFSPSCATVNTNITILGNNLNSVSSATLNGAAMQIITQTPSSLVLRVQAAFTDAPIVLNYLGGSVSTTTAVLPTPAAPVITPVGATTFCQGGSVTLNSNYPTGNLWSTNAHTQSITVFGSGIYTVVHTAANGCVSPASESVSVIVNSLPIITISPNAPTIAPGSNAILTASGASTYQWSPLIAIAPPSGVGATVTVSPAATTTYTVIGTSNGCSSDAEVVVTVDEETSPEVLVAPTISPETGTYADPQILVISSPQEGVVIYYTTNGNVPVIGSVFTRVYTAPILILESRTVRAIATKPGSANSPVARSIITILEPGIVAQPVISPNSGSFNEPTQVSITCATPGAEIYYTTNGNSPRFDVPNSFTKLYNGPFTLTSSATIRSVARKDGLVNSPVALANINVSVPKVATPVITPGTGTFTGPQSVSITCSTPGAQIYYTTNGNNPRFDIPNHFTKLYTGPFLLSTSRQVKSVALLSGSLNSDMASSTITIGAGTRQALETDDTWQISAYPNPASLSFTLQWTPLDIQDLHISILSLAGKVVYENTTSAVEGSVIVDVERLPRGVYMCKVVFDNRSKVLKVVKH